MKRINNKRKIGSNNKRKTQLVKDNRDDSQVKTYKSQLNTQPAKTLPYFATLSSIILSVLVVSAIASAATTISTNISTGGTLAVTGASTLTGGFLSTASSTVVGNFTVTGACNGCSTYPFTAVS